MCDYTIEKITGTVISQKRNLLLSIKLSRHVTGTILNHILLRVDRPMCNRIRIRNLFLILLFINRLIDRDISWTALGLRLLVHATRDLRVLREGLHQHRLWDCHLELRLSRAVLHVLRVMLVEASASRIYRSLLS